MIRVGLVFHPPRLSSRRRRGEAAYSWFPQWVQEEGRRMRSGPQQVTCCIAGGGPAGVMLGFLLARAGVGTVVLEKHQDFFRDFRGDTIHPSTLQIMHELGLLDAFLKLPHQEIRALGVLVGDTEIQLADS